MQYGLIGEKLGHSYSARIHAMLGNADYALCPLSPEGMRALLKSRDFQGLNVTIPYKKEVLPFCDALTDEARAIGSANTLAVRGGKLIAHNTDLGGFIALAARAGVEIAGRKAAILGSGGTSLTARAACRQLGAKEVVVVSRSGPVTYEALFRDHADVEVLINTTPVGMYPNNADRPPALDRLPKLAGVLDAIYNPDRTALVLAAKERGIPAAGGLWMLVAQAALAHEWFFGARVSEERVAEIYRALLRERLNLALIGMPGSGKTMIGRALAEKLGRAFVDTDHEIEQRIGISIPQFFAENGEAAFRAVEAEVVREVGKESGAVIATGGGAPMFPENVRALRQNGVLLQIARPVELLSSAGRPLSGDVELRRALEARREPTYRACSDARIENDGAPGEAVEKALRAFLAEIEKR